MWAVTESAEVARDVLAVILPDLVGYYGSASASLAADWYDDLRDQAGVDSRFRAIAAELPDQGALDSLVGWGTQPLWPRERTWIDEEGAEQREILPADPAAALGRVTGGFQRIVGDAHRDTVIGSLTRDPSAKGWSRQTTGLSCDFCVMLAGRGAVYSAKTALFSSHNNCDCIAVPKWGDPVGVKPYVPSQKFRTQEQRDRNNAALRAYLNRGTTSGGGGRRVTAAGEPRDVDSERTVEQLRATVAALEKSLARFDSPGTRARVEDLRRKIAART